MPQEESAYLKYIPMPQAVYRSQAQTRATVTVSIFNFSIHAINPTFSKRRVSTSAVQLKNL